MTDPQNMTTISSLPAGEEAGGVRELRALDRDTCVGLLSGQRLGRLAFTRRALPDIVPVNFVLSPAGTVLIRLEEDSTVARAVENAVVAFEVDQLDPDTRTGWSVTVIGVCRRVELPAQPAGAGPVPWAPGDRRAAFAIDLEQLSGRELTPMTRPDAGTSQAC
jgi:uncharacterized protein